MRRRLELAGRETKTVFLEAWRGSRHREKFGQSRKAERARCVGEPGTGGRPTAAPARPRNTDRRPADVSMDAAVTIQVSDRPSLCDPQPHQPHINRRHLLSQSGASHVPIASL